MKSLLVMIVGVVAVVAGQTPARDAVGTVPTGGALLSGRVADTDGQPIRRAMVAIAGDMGVNKTTITNDAGAFTFDRLPPGRFTLTASKPGYPPMSYGAKRAYRAGAGVSLKADQALSGIALTLARGAVVTGTVFDEKGQPQPEVPIMAWEVRTSLGGERTISFPPSGGEWVTTDDRGVYRIYGLPPGDYTVGTSWAFSGGQSNVRVPTDAEMREAFSSSTPAAAPTSKPSSPPATYSYAPVFYPSVVDPLAATTFTLQAGEERTGIDIYMQFRPMGRLDVMVLGPNGPANDARISLMRRNAVEALNSTMISSTTAGRFTATSLGPGNYTVIAETRPAGEMPALWASEDVALTSAEPVSITLRLQTGANVTGQIAFEGTTLAPPADLTKIRITLLPAARNSPLSNNSEPTISANGEFIIKGVTPGRYRVSASIPGSQPGAGWRVRSVRNGGQDVTDLPIDVAPGTMVPLVVTFFDRVSELSGTLRLPSGDAALDYFVVVMPADRNYWGPLTRRIVSTRPDLTGRYVFRGLPAGDYRVAVTTDLLPADLQDMSALERLLATSTPVSIGEGEQKSFDIKISG